MKGISTSPSDRLTIMVLEEQMAICLLPCDSPLPGWLDPRQFHSVTRTTDELSIVCPELSVPEGIRCEPGWRILQVKGPLDFSMTGILASLVTPLAEAGIGVFNISTYNTDYLLVKTGDLDQTVRILGNFCTVQFR